MLVTNLGVEMQLYNLQAGKDSIAGLESELENLLVKFQTLFEEPTDLPPTRLLDQKVMLKKVLNQ